MMKLPARLTLILLCALMIVALPFFVPSPRMTQEAETVYFEEEEGEDEAENEIDFESLLFSAARAEDAPDDLIVEETDGSGLMVSPEWELPIDFSIPPAPNPAHFTENGYEDESVRVTVETRQEEGVTWYIAYIQIASPTQLRTAVSQKGAKVSNMAEKNNAVIAINGDYFTNDPAKTPFEFRMGQNMRNFIKGNEQKDILVIDDQGDFHLYPRSGEDGQLFERTTKKGKKAWNLVFPGTVVNAFTFGPALVIDGVEQDLEGEYGYHPKAKEPRSAIGQTGKLSYVFVIAAATDRDGKTGVTHKELASFMHSLGCLQAFNLDGGGTAEMVMNGIIYKASPNSTERSQSDIIYIATCVPEQ